MASRNLYLTADGFDIENGPDNNLRFTDNATEFISQKIESHVGIQLGEYYLHPDKGVDYQGQILKKNTDLNLVKSLILLAITEIDEVDEIISMEVDLEKSTRTYRIKNLVVRTTDGDIINGVFR